MEFSRSGRIRLIPLVLACAAVIAAYVASGPWVFRREARPPAAGQAYPLLVAGLRAGHLFLPVPVPPGLVRLPDPYAPASNVPYRWPPWSLGDLSYFRGRIYLYFGITPALLLFWPAEILTGRPLAHDQAVLLCAVAGFLAGAAVLADAWRRYFWRAGAGAAAAALVGWGAVGTVPILLVRPGLWEVPVVCGGALVTAAFGALWAALHSTGGARRRWLALASLAWGLAVGSRPTVLVGAPVLLVPVAAAALAGRFGDRRGLALNLLAALGPILAVGIGLAAYNAARFGNPLEFGHHYQLSADNVHGRIVFSPAFFVDNVRLYLLEPLRWHGGFPYLWKPAVPPLSPGHGGVEFFVGALPALPFLLFAAAPLSAGTGGGSQRCALCWFRGSLLWTAAAVGALLCCFYGASHRYEVEFLGPLALLACLGYLAWEDRWAAGAGDGSRGLAGVLARGSARLALAASVAAVGLLTCALALFYRDAGRAGGAAAAGRIGEAEALYSRVARINPDFEADADFSLGNAWMAAGRSDRAAEFYRCALSERPGFADAAFNLGNAWMAEGRPADAADCYREALRTRPDDAEVLGNLGIALFRAGRTAEAVAEEEAALRIRPDLDSVRSCLAAMRSAPGRAP